MSGLLTDDIEVLSGPRSNSIMCFRTESRYEWRNEKDTHKVPRQDSHPFLLTKDCFTFVEWRSEMSIPCQEEQDVTVRFRSSGF
jgi:hypothetical protein